jgi:PKD repeat protein
MHTFYTRFITFLLIGLPVFSSAQSIGDPIAICDLFKNSQVYNGFVKIDPVTGQPTMLNTWAKIIYAFGQNTVDNVNNTYYLASTDSANMYLLKFDICSGAILDTVFQYSNVGPGPGWNWIALYITGITYNPVDNHVYFAAAKLASNTGKYPFFPVKEYIMSADAVTGQLSVIDSASSYQLFQRQYLDATHQKLYAINNQSLYSYDLATKTYSAMNLSNTLGVNMFYDLVLNLSDNHLYGIEMDYNSFSAPLYTFLNRVVKLDPQSGQLTYLSAPFLANTVSMDLSIQNNSLYFIGTDTSHATGFMSFNLPTQQLSFFNNNTPNYILTGLNIHTGQGSSVPDSADFTANNFCEHAPTYFYPKKAGNVTWDFGDPASGLKNKSTLYNPTHIFSSAGTYTVQMMYYTCNGPDTVSKVITIQPFPVVDLGNDTAWCKEYPYPQLLLNPNIHLTTNTWQDGTTSTTYTVTQPGTYWVTVKGSCGEVKDTLRIKSISCPCEFELWPTLTSSDVFINYDCYLFKDKNLDFELYNNLGQMIWKEKIIQSPLSIPTNQLANEIYYFRIRNETELLKSGKITVMH